MCPYDKATLPPPVIEEAFRTHPVVGGDGGPITSDLYRTLDLIAQPFDS